MAFRALNDPAAPVNPAGVADQAEEDAVDWDIIAAALGGTGVISGCAVTAGAGAMQVSVASGVVVINGQIVTVAAQPNIAVGAADGSLNRIDLVIVNTSGTASVSAGAANANACMANVIAGAAVAALAAVMVSAADTTIGAADITDKRCVLGAPVIPGAWAKTGQINPVAISGSFNNVNPTGFSTCSTYIQDLTGNSTFTGLSGGSTGRRILLVNAATQSDGFTLTLKNENASSTDVNRFHTPNEADYILAPGAGVELKYDAADPGNGGAAGRWRVIDRRLPTATVVVEKLYVWHMGSGAAITGNALGGYLATNNLGLTETVTKLLISSDPTAGTSATVVLELGSSDDLDTLTWNATKIKTASVGAAEEGYNTTTFTDADLEPNRLLRCNITAISGTYNNMTVKMYTTITLTVTVT